MQTKMTITSLFLAGMLISLGPGCYSDAQFTGSTVHDTDTSGDEHTATPSSPHDTGGAEEGEDTTALSSEISHDIEHTGDDALLVNDTGHVEDSGYVEDTEQIEDTSHIEDSDTQEDESWDGGCPPTPEYDIVAPKEAVHQVTFIMENPGPEPVYVASEGFMCDAWAINGVPRHLGFSCGCECPNPGAPLVWTWQRLDVGESLAVEWDGRGLVTYGVPINCCEVGWGDYIVWESGGALQPVEAGTYAFQTVYRTDIPENCWTSDDGSTVHCDQDPWGSEYGGFDTFQYLCDDYSAFTVSFSFELPEQGDVSVSVPLSEGFINP